MYIALHVNYPLFLSDFNETLKFSTDFRRILNRQISLKSVQWEMSRSMRTDGQTDMTNLILTFRNSAKALQMGFKTLQTSLPPLYKNILSKPLLVELVAVTYYRVGKCVFSKFVAVRNLAIAAFLTGTNITDD
jgi:hypothetical protein